MNQIAAQSFGMFLGTLTTDPRLVGFIVAVVIFPVYALMPAFAPGLSIPPWIRWLQDISVYNWASKFLLVWAWKDFDLLELNPVEETQARFPQFCYYLPLKPEEIGPDYRKHFISCREVQNSDVPADLFVGLDETSFNGGKPFVLIQGTQDLLRSRYNLEVNSWTISWILLVQMSLVIGYFLLAFAIHHFRYTVNCSCRALCMSCGCFCCDTRQRSRLEQEGRATHENDDEETALLIPMS
ncbi:unnamed protein product [Amoebophrya sp. A120]|nr:unnamed protein product [Amoebophrya sp. A120]|eukprot:GSA120T00011975001.1